MFCEGSGQVGKGSVRVSLIFGEDVADDVSCFKTDGELSASAGVIRTREEWSKRLQHGRSREVESSLASWTVLADILHECGGATNCSPMNSRFVGDDCAGLDVGKSRERSFEEVHHGRIISVAQHPRPNVRQEILLYRKFIKLRKEGQRLLLRHAGDEFRQWLRRQAYSLNSVTRGFKFGLYLSQHDEGISNLLLVGRSFQPHESSDRPYLRFGRRRGTGTGLSGRLHRNNQDNGKDISHHYDPSDMKWRSSIAYWPVCRLTRGSGSGAVLKST